jgi:Domain of unknown function (DUF4185)
VRSIEAIIRSARHLRNFPRRRAELWEMVGQDGGQSIDLGASTLFVFSDTLLTVRPSPAGPDGSFASLAAPDKPCLFLANCAAISDGKDIDSGLDRMRYLSGPDGFPIEILVPNAEERAVNLRFWPGHGLVIDSTVYLYYVGVEIIDPADPWAFRPFGSGLATFDPTTGTAERICREGNWCLWPSRSDDFHFGVQVIRRGDEVYVFGSQRNGLDHHSIVGRVPVNRISDPAAYAYLVPESEDWVHEEEHAGSLGPCASDYSVAYNRHLGVYLMCYADGFTKQLMMRVADDLSGPYSVPLAVGRLPHHRTSELIYLGFQHPKFARDGGQRLYVSYCQPSFAMPSVVELRLR